MVSEMNDLANDEGCSIDVLRVSPGFVYEVRPRKDHRDVDLISAS
jgi:hypothetical protein